MAQNMVYITTIGVWVCANRCILSLKWYNSAMNRQRILVTGVNGFVGPHLVRELLGRGCAVDGVGYGPEPENSTKHEDYNYIACDLTDMEEVTQKISTAGLSAVIHLAGLSSPAKSFEQPQRYIADNSAMLINLFENILANKPEKLPRFAVISSGALYAGDQEMPLTESSKIFYNSPYAVSKATNEHITDYYRLRGFDNVVIRPFNHIGPGQTPGFIVSDLTSQAIEAGANGTITVGNLTTRRDYTDVRDVVKAYADIALAPTVEHSLYNVSSGISRSGEDILAAITKSLYGNDASLNVQVDQSRIRPGDTPEIVGDASLIREEFGWQPSIPFEQTIQDYVDWSTSQNA